MITFWTIVIAIILTLNLASLIIIFLNDDYDLDTLSFISKCFFAVEGIIIGLIVILLISKAIATGVVCANDRGDNPSCTHFNEVVSGNENNQ